MIIKWNGNGIKVIPCLGIKGQTVDKVILIPGNNDVSEVNWKAARIHCLDEIKSGDIEDEIAAEIKVEEVEVESVDPKTNEKVKVKEKKVKFNVTEFAKLDIKKAIEVVKDTYNLDTLKKWEHDEGRNSVRAELINQIEEVESHHEDRKKKKENK